MIRKPPQSPESDFPQRQRLIATFPSPKVCLQSLRN
jgi:hypothetical protein